MHKITHCSRVPLTQFTRYSCREHLHPVYFRYQVHFQLFFPLLDFRSFIDRYQKVLQVNIQYLLGSRKIYPRKHSTSEEALLITYLGSSVSTNEKDIDTRLTKAWPAWLRADEEKKQKVPRKNNYRRRLCRWHSDTGEYTRPSRDTTA